MAFSVIKDLHLNNLERNSASAVYHMDFKEDMADGDFIVLGRIPSEVLVTSMVVLISSADVAATDTVVSLGQGTGKDDGQFGFWGNFRPQYNGIHRTTIPVTDNILLDGSPYDGGDNYQNITANKDSYLLARIDDFPSFVPGSSFDVVLDYTYYGTKQTGGYLE